MTRPVRGVVAGVLLGGLLLGCVPACTAPPDPPARSRPLPDPHSSSAAPRAGTAPAGRRAAVTALLEARARAVRTRDRAAFLATIDPAASPAFRTAQARQFDNLRAVPLATWRYLLGRPAPAGAERTADAGNSTPATSPVPPASPGSTARSGHTRAPAAETWAPAVELRYALTGIDPQPVGRPLGYLFVRRGARWYLHADTAARGWRGPWDFGPCVVLRERRGLVIAHPDRLRAARRIAAELDAAVDTVDAVWPERWTGRVAVLVPSSRAELRAQLGTDPPAGVAAVATAASSDLRTHIASGQRVVFHPASVSELDVPATRILLRHEITHIATRAYTADGSPQWVAEGFADYVGYRDSGLPVAGAAPELAADVRYRGPPAGPPADAAFTGREPGIGLAYQQAWTIARYVRNRFSEPALVRLYRTIAAHGPATPAAVDADVRAAIGIPLAQLVAGWRHYLTDLLR